ncbi:MAG: outer membrane protein transport protein [Proteobacteria bacterium]|nr:outer membrane protein transport protein [Pseudomonadota bacterium]
MKQKKLHISVIVILLTMVFPSLALSHGWAGYEQGAKARGMGGAFTGLADDPTAIYYNPAGIVQLEGTELSLGFAAVSGIGRFESAGTSGMPGISPGKTADLDQQYFFIPNLYITSKINDKISLGLAEYTIYGLGFTWEDSFEGRFAPGSKHAELKTMTLNPVIACQVTDTLSLAVGGRLERADLTLENKIFVAPGVDEVNSEISGDDYSLGWNAALLYTISKEWHAGLNYRSQIRHSFKDLDVEFSPQIDALGPIPVGIINTNANLNVILPQFASFGLAWSRGPLTVTADGYWWQWSKIKELRFDLENPVAGQTALGVPMNWEDTLSWAMGTEYMVKAFDRDIRLRGGFMYEQCPIPDNAVSPVGFQGDNLIYSVGAGSRIGPFYSDFFFSYVKTNDRTWNNAIGNAPNPGGGPVSGEFKDYGTYIIGSNITYKF